MFAWFLLAYGGVFAAEALYDNSLYTTATLATRYRSLPVLCGASMAFMAKMLTAVLIGAAIRQWLQNEFVETVVRALGVLTFLVMAMVLWRRKPQGKEQPVREARPAPQIAIISLFAILFCEFIDDGQAVAGALAAGAQSHPGASLAITLIWLGATLALITKGILTVTFGGRIREWIPELVLRYTAIALCVGLAAFTWLKSDAGEKARDTGERRGEVHASGTSRADDQSRVNSGASRSIL